MSEPISTAPATFVVVGGSSGIGQGVAAAALASGARVVIASRSADRLAQAAVQLGAPERLQTVATDVTNEDDVQRLFETAGAVDHVVVTAVDVAGYRPLAQQSVADLRRAIDSKLVGPLLIAKHAPVHMPRGGSITFTGGIAAERPAPGGAVVAAVNAALTGLTRALAVELAPIRVNALSPGWVATPAWDAVAGEKASELLAVMGERVPLRRLGTPADVGRAALLVADAELVNGTVIPLDGGQRLI